MIMDHKVFEKSNLKVISHFLKSFFLPKFLSGHLKRHRKKVPRIIRQSDNGFALELTYIKNSKIAVKLAKNCLTQIKIHLELLS